MPAVTTRRPSARSRRTSIALGATLLAAAASPAAARAQAAARGYTYAFVIGSDDDKERTEGTMRVAGDRARVDVRGEGDGPFDYLLLSDHGSTLTVVNPKEREYSVSDADRFTSIVGAALRAVSALVSFDVEDPKIETQRLGAGGRVAGIPTQRYAIAESYVVNVRAFGTTTPEYHHMVTDYWVASSLELPPNPIFELMSRVDAALAQSDAAYVRRAAEARASLFHGTPLRIVVTSIKKDDKPSTEEKPTVRTIEVTRVQEGPVDAAALEVPRGFRRRTDGLSWRVRM